HNDWLDAGPGEAAKLVADRGPEGLRVDLETENGVRYDQRIGAGCLRCFADGNHIAGIGRKLAPDRLIRGPANEAHDVERMFLVEREIATLRVARGTGDVDLQDIDVGFADIARHGFEIFDGGGRDGSDEG